MAQAPPQSPGRSPLPPGCREEGTSFGDSCGPTAISGDSALAPGSHWDGQAPAVSRGKSPSPLGPWLVCHQTAPKLRARPCPLTVFWSLLVRSWAGSRAESSGRPHPRPPPSLHHPCCHGRCTCVPWNGLGTARGFPVRPQGSLPGPVQPSCRTKSLLCPPPQAFVPRCLVFVILSLARWVWPAGARCAPRSCACGGTGGRALGPPSRASGGSQSGPTWRGSLRVTLPASRHTGPRLWAHAAGTGFSLALGSCSSVNVAGTAPERLLESRVGPDR